jgi:pilus assembly protein FimV
MLNMLRRGTALALLMGASVAVYGAGLGKLTVNSSLGQVLDAEIDLVSVQPGELDSMTARVSSPDAFREARIEYVGSLRLLRFSVEKRPNGQPFLKVTSSAPINEPFVDALIEVTWPAGRIQREYPILLDPPGYAQQKPPVTAAARAAAPPAAAPAASSSAPATASVTPATGAPGSRTELATTPPGSGDSYGPVKKGDTLNKIATEVKPQDVSLEQMLVALYRENQSAFVGNNMNRLKTGQILKVPSAEDVSKIEQKEARTEIRTQVADWKGYRDQVASGVASMPARTESSRTASGKVGTAAVTPSAPPAAESKDVLKLSKADAAGKAGAAKGGGGNQARIDALQEEVASKDRALKEAQSRVADLEKQIQQMQRLIDLKSGAPAKPADTKAAAVPPPAPAKEAPKVAEVKPEPAKPAEAPKVAEAPKAEPPKTEPPKAEAPKTEAPKVAEAPKPAPPKPAAAAKKAPPPKDWTDDLMDNWPILAGGIAALGLLAGGAFMFIRRRKERAEAGPSSNMTSAFPSDLKPTTDTGKPGGGLVDTGNSSFLTDFDKTGPGTIDTDEVDPVAEAEVYIAYGRDAQAEEILKEAFARDKTRTEIPLKLLEIYHARKSATAFEGVAKELKEIAGESSPAWQKAAAMGAQIDPTNPLYAGADAGAAPAAAAAAAPAHKPDLDFDINAPTSAAAPAPSFDLDLDSQKSAGGSGASAESGGLDFDINAPASSSVDVSSEAAKDEKAASFDFDLSGLDMGGKQPPDAEKTSIRQAAAQPAAAPSFDLGDLSLDSTPADAGGGGDSEAVGTKLELAKAYLEIGDKDGAREILQEVAKEGSSAQKEEAKKLIASL